MEEYVTLKTPYEIVFVHKYLRKFKPKTSVCQLCEGKVCGNKQPFFLANIKNHEYTNNPDDYRWASNKCHILLDGTSIHLQHNCGLRGPDKKPRKKTGYFIRWEREREKKKL
jgi:hypothetical protein